MADTAREYTREEARDAFLGHVRHMVEYWNQVDNTTKEEALQGLAFSIMVALDGGSMALPAFAVIPAPHPEDKNFLMKNGENWYPPFEPDKELCDIAGGLHELLKFTK